ncbi:YceI family protein [Sphingobacterium lumbrici]|uniref:YceI family protein n=1 Tax=Sphingobacterium lumbrici TaxID=2559600 RepID=UPI00112AA055|nr:YceI family protein [Sphingobacterium lumbrici]
MKNLILLVVFILSSSFAEFPTTKKEYTFKVMRNSYIIINGSSNVNKFGCKVMKPTETKPLKAVITSDYKVNLDGAIRVKVDEFDCENNILNKDLRKTLKAENYPYMTISFKSLDQIPFTEGEDTVTGTIIIELAGTTKEFKIPLSFIKKGNIYQMKGSKCFTFADFNLSPPKKIGGLIKVKDEFQATFMLSLQNQ